MKPFFVTITKITTCIFFLSMLCHSAFAAVNGTLELDYAHYEAQVGGASVTDTDQFAQKYSIAYDKAGKFLEGRGGKYRITLGGEWSALDNQIETQALSIDSSIETSKILYRGELDFAPGGLPFSLRLYSRDIIASRFEEDSIFGGAGNFEEYGIQPFRTHILTPHIIDDISDGQTIESGVSFVLGIRNGSYLGRYRNVLSHFPKLYFDYRELEVKDLDTRTPEHYKDREMAFVSLNKKHNWLHYRFFDHRDMLAPSENYEESLILLGTIDQSLKREWVNLTNWVQISVDGSYEEATHPLSSSSRNEKTYALNLFTKTSRPKWRSSSFSNFERVEEVDRLNRELFVPVFADGSISRNTSWRFQFFGYSEKENLPFSLINQESSDNILYATSQLDLNKSKPLTISPKLQIETRSGDQEGKGNAAKLGVSLSSNNKINPDNYLFASLEFAYFSSEGSPLLLNSDVFSEVISRLAFSRQVTGRFRSGIEGDFVFGSGNSLAAVTEYIQPVSDADYLTNFYIPGGVSEDSLKISTTVFGEYVGRNRLRNRLDLGVDYSEVDSDDNVQGFVTHRLDYLDGVFQIDWVSRVVVGDSIKTAVLRSSTAATGTLIGGAGFDGYAFSSKGSARYSYNRNWTFSGDCLYEKADGKLDGQGGDRIKLNQDVRYVRYLPNARQQRIFDFEEYIDYEFFDSESNFTSQLIVYALIGNYYPTSWSRLGGKVKSQQDLEQDIIETGFGIYADFIFSKLDVGFEYEIGMRTDDTLGTLFDRDEQRWKISLKKIF